MTARIAILCHVVCLLSPNSVFGTAPEVQFHRDVRPILSNYCFRCHGPDAESREADLRLDQRAGLFGESAAGGVVISPGDAAGSELYRRITTDHGDQRMPPAESNLALTDRQIDTIRTWIADGAAWEDHWAYRPIVRPNVPDVEGIELVNPIDAFIAEKLVAEGLRFSPPADSITLIRRLSFDLTGLPPTSTQVASYTTSPNEPSYELLVERLLSSADYGERMAVHWLDLVRYADSCGYHSDVDQPISPYRDYVIDAFNRNMPFDQFTREQLAGDLLPEPTLAQRVATGYNRLNKTTEEGGAQAGEYEVKSAADRVRTTSGVWLATTLGCAECHDHKYDPVTTSDFYSFAAFFADVAEQGVYKSGNRAPELAVPTPEQQEHRVDLVARIASIEQRLAGTDDDRTVERSELEQQVKAMQADLRKLEASITRTMITVSTTPREVRVLPRGNWLDPSGPVVQPAIPAFLASAQSSDRRFTRLDLADWLVSRENPLTGRVFVNRLWKLFFGAGLARQLEDFGAQGEIPTHPELLNWLAIEFMDSDWDIKHMIRLMTTSRTYRQSSIPPAQLPVPDPQNRLFARQSRWRLEAEFIRDTALFHAGLLVCEVGGPSVKPYQPEGYWEFLNFPKRTWQADHGRNQYRRGLYTHWQRTFLHPSLLAFDASSREECTAQRSVSNTPQAALTLLNDPTYVECARAFATRILAESIGRSDEARIEWAWHAALSRQPDEREQQILLTLLGESRARFVADESAARELLAVGRSPLAADAPTSELATWTEIARTILNLHEAICRN